MNDEVLKIEFKKLVDSVDTVEFEQDCYCTLVRQMILNTYNVN